MSNIIKKAEMQQQLKDCVELLKNILGTDLLGVYLYGSALVGGLQRYSDIDLFVVANRVTTVEEKKQLIANLLLTSGLYMKDSKLPLEITIVVKAAVNPWQYPPTFDFQYGEWLRESFNSGIIEPWSSYEMPDLALIITQILLKSQTLWGLEPKQLLAPAPYNDFMKAMLNDLDRLYEELEHDTRNVLLTYARTWSTLETSAIRSKPAAADWVINRLPEIHQPVMQRAKSICVGVENEHWDDIEALIKPCVDFMLDRINAQASLLDLRDPNKVIRLDEPSDTIIETERLILRQWRDSDLQAMSDINQDPRVMEHFPATKTTEETKAFINGSKALFNEVGYCFYAAELKKTHELIGFVGIAPVYEMPCTPAIEIGWRLGAKFWGHGLATEAAKAVINYAFNILELDELVSFTATTNKKSEQVMQRLGFSRCEQDDFDHPRIVDGHPLKRHMFYRLKKSEY